MKFYVRSAVLQNLRITEQSAHTGHSIGNGERCSTSIPFKLDRYRMEYGTEHSWRDDTLTCNDLSPVTKQAVSATCSACFKAGRKSSGGIPSDGDMSREKA